MKILTNVIMTLLSLTSLTVYSADKAQLTKNFKAAYSQFQTTLKNKPNKACKIEKLAHKSYNLGCQLYGKESQNCQNLALNFANNVCIWSKSKQQALTIYQQIISQKKQQSTPENQAKNLLDIYITILNNKAFHKKPPAFIKQVFQETLSFANEFQTKDPVTAAIIIASINQTHFNLKQHKQLIVNAFNTLQKTLPPNDALLFSLRNVVASILINEKQTKQAIALMEKNVDIISTNTERDSLNEIKLRTRLIALYKQTKQAPKITKHCQAIGLMRPWNNNQEQIPLIRVPPIYPLKAQRAEAEQSLIMSFTLDEFGFVHDVKVVEREIATRIGKLFDKEAIKALKQWRFAPRFVDGQAVKTENLKVKLDFIIG